MKKALAASAVLLTALALSGCEIEDTTSGSTGGSSDSSDSKKAAGPKYTVNQQQAITAAKGYLEMGTGYSRTGLIQQLSSAAGEGFAKEDAVFAVDSLKIDYKKQAVLCAKGYMDMGGYSRQGLIDQLSSKAGEQFSVENATYAADQVGLK